MRIILGVWCCVLVCGVCGMVNGAREGPDEVDVAIVGAGPGGLQLAHYLASAGRSYVVLNRDLEVGSFFRRFPKYRRLISVNKRHTGREEWDFNMRHDWNSLLSDPSHVGEGEEMEERGFSKACARASSTSCGMLTSSVHPGSLLMGNWSRGLFPHADELASYMEHFASERKLRIVSNAKVEDVELLGGGEEGFDCVGCSLRGREGVKTVGVEGDGRRVGEEGGGFLVRYVEQSIRKELKAKNVVLATGIGKERKDVVRDPEHCAISYSELPVDADEMFEGKRVLILGRGNAAFEVAAAAIEVASQVHVVGPEHGRIRLAWETHYPGDVRHLHAGLLETYMLKTQDGLLEASLDRLNLSCNTSPSKQIYVTELDAESSDRSPFRKPYDVVVSALGWEFDSSILPSIEFKTWGGAQRRYDVEIGSKFDIPAPSNVPWTYTEKLGSKFPRMTPAFEHPTVPNLYFAGSLMHARDYRQSSGGFIHGFRYLVRSLHRYMEYKAGHPWPGRKICGVESVLQTFQERWNLASGPYQMFGQLVDVWEWMEDEEFCGWFAEEIPLGQIYGAARDGIGWCERHVCILSSLEFGRITPVGRLADDDYPDVFSVRRADVGPDDAYKSKFLHPVLRLQVEGRTRSRLDIVEDFLSEWTGPTAHIAPARSWLDTISERLLTKGPWTDLEQVEELKSRDLELSDTARLASLRPHLLPSSVLAPTRSIDDDIPQPNGFRITSSSSYTSRIKRIIDTQNATHVYWSGSLLVHGYDGWSTRLDPHHLVLLLHPVNLPSKTIELWTSSKPASIATLTKFAISLSSKLPSTPIFLIETHTPIASQIAHEDDITSTPQDPPILILHTKNDSSSTWTSTKFQWSQRQSFLRSLHL